MNYYYNSYVKIYSKFILFLLIVFYTNVHSQSNGWKNINLSIPYSNGEVRSIAVGDSGRIFISMSYYGVYRTTDYGSTWLSANNGLPASQSGSFYFENIAVSKRTNHVFGNNNNLLFRSTNDGKSWEKVYIKPDSSFYYTIYDIKIDSDGKIYLATYKGVFFSSDDGVTWNNLSEGFQQSALPIVQIEISPKGRLYSLATGSSIYKYNITSGIWNKLPSINQKYTMLLDMTIDHSGTLYVLTNNDFFYKTTDDGIHWKKITYMPSYYTDIESDSKDNIYLGTDNGISVSKDGGNHWKGINNGLPGSIIDFIHPCSNGWIFASTTYKGVYVTSDYGKNWYLVKGLPMAPGISDLTIASNNRIFTSTFNGHLLLSTDSGITWKYDDLDPYNYYVTSLSSNDSSRLVIVDGNTVYCSINNGKTFNRYNKSAMNAIVLPNNTIFACGNTYEYQPMGWVSRSTDDGISWTLSSMPDPSWQRFGGIAASRENIIYLCGYFTDRLGGFAIYNFYRSDDNGISWVKIFSVTYNGYNTTDPEYPSGLGCGSNGAVFISSNKGIYRSTDKGDNWVKIDSSSDRSNIKEFIPAGNGKIFAYHDSLIILSTDNGLTWNNYESFSGITTLAVDKNGYLYFGTNKNFIYTNAPITIPQNPPIGLPDTTSSELPGKFSLFQNYPNPFNSSTIIQYSLPEVSHISIKIYDVLGREIKEIINTDKPAGTYSIRLFMNYLSSGVYFYRLQAGSFTQTKKLVLLK